MVAAAVTLQCVLGTASPQALWHLLLQQKLPLPRQQLLLQQLPPALGQLLMLAGSSAW